MKLLRDMRHGELWQVGGTYASVAEDDSGPMPAADVLRYFARLIVDIGADRGLAIDTTPIIRLAARLDADMPIDDGALRPVEEIFELARRIAAPIPTDRMVAILREQERVPQPPTNQRPDRTGPHEAHRP